MADSILRTRSKEFAKHIFLLCRELKDRKVEAAIVNQMLRSGTSVGANIHEAQYAQGTRDFISKLEIALKECNETEYWAELLYESGSLPEAEFTPLKKEIVDLRRMIVSSVKKLKLKLPDGFDL